MTAGRGCRPGRRRRARAPARRSRWGRRRSRRGRPGTRSPRAGLPATSASTASKAWRLPWMSETMATCMDLRGRLRRGASFTNVERLRRVAVAVVAAVVVAEAAVAAAAAARRRHRARRRSTPDRTSAPPSSSARALPRGRSSRSFAAGARDRGRRCSRGSCAARRARLRGPFRRPVLAAAGAGAALSVGLAVAPLPLGAISRQRAVDVGPRRPRPGAAGLGDVGQVDGDRRGRSRAPARRGRAGAHAPLPARAGGCPAAAGVVGVRGGRHLRWARSCSTRSSTASRRCPRAHARATCSARRARRASTVGAGLRGRRQPPHDGRQRLRHRARARPSASCSSTPARRTSRRDEMRLVVAHELGHVRYRDVPRGLLYVALVAPRGAARGRAADAPPGARRAAARPGRRCRRWRCRSRSSASAVDDRRQPALAARSRRAPTRSRCSLTDAPRAVHRLRAADRACATSPTPTRRAGCVALLGAPTRRRVERIGIAQGLRGRRAPSAPTALVVGSVARPAARRTRAGS